MKFVIIILRKRLGVHITTLCASSLLARVSLESFSSNSEDHLVIFNFLFRDTSLSLDVDNTNPGGGDDISVC